MPSDGKSSHCLWQGELIIDLLHIPDLILKLYVLHRSYFPYDRQNGTSSTLRKSNRKPKGQGFFFIIFLSLWIPVFEPCKKSDDNFTAIRKFTSCYKINILYRL
jgi:hypothetical protein